MSTQPTCESEKIDVPQPMCVDCTTRNEPEPKRAWRQGRCKGDYDAAVTARVITKRKRRPNGTPPPECTVEGCDKPQKANDLCGTHNARAWRGVDVDAPFRGRVADTCVFDDCDKPVHSKDLCGGHNAQRAAGKPLTPLRSWKRLTGTCAVDGCDRDIAHADLCDGHYRRKSADREDWAEPIRDKAPAGTGHVNPQGYRVIYVEGRKTAEHIYNFEQVLGRRLLPGENVHHRRGERTDNGTDGPPRMTEDGKLVSGNLELWSTKQPAGQEVGQKLDWAVELVELYREYLPDELRERLAAALA